MFKTHASSIQIQIITLIVKRNGCNYFLVAKSCSHVCDVSFRQSRYEYISGDPGVLAAMLLPHSQQSARVAVRLTLSLIKLLLLFANFYTVPKVITITVISDLQSRNTYRTWPWRTFTAHKYEVTTLLAWLM